MLKLLFLCSQNRLRSPTAEQVFSGDPGLECDSAGLFDTAEVPVGPEQLAWADLIFVMEPIHRRRLNQKFKRHLQGKRVIVLGIPDDYDYMQPALIELLERKVRPFLPGVAR